MTTAERLLIAIALYESRTRTLGVRATLRPAWHELPAGAKAHWLEMAAKELQG